MRQLVRTLLSALLVFGMLSGCAAVGSDSETTEPIDSVLPSMEASNTAQDAKTAADILEEMTLREKVGQLFIIRPDALDETLSQAVINDAWAEGVTSLSAEMIEYLNQYPVGGVVMYTKNIVSPQQITVFNTALQAACTIPMFIAVDEEGGSVSRLANHSAFDLPRYESAAAVGASEDPADALEMGRTIGAYLAEYGFNMNFAPVADVNTNPDNPVIGDRAFSASTETATDMAAAMADGLNQQGIIATFKHFPGHGDTAEDSHFGLAVTYRTGRQLANREILPFLKADSNDFIMAGHIAVPEETGDMTPASMSEYMITLLLKGNLEFDGLVITDSLSMDAITEAYSPSDAALTALQAGCDILLNPNDLAGTFDAVVDAVADGTLSEEWLDETVLRILEFKILHGIIGD